MATSPENAYEILIEMFTKLDTKFDAMYEFMIDKFARIDEHFAKVDQEIAKLTATTLEIQDNLASMGYAVDKDAKTIIEHEKRIGRLEKTQKFA
jgi:hypothetical protein